ncbi:MAG: hypothetical protein LC795_04045 [Acidobacteria bacterium]|nr:hypothetical protein [Acidobacteriota bacterium]
MTNDEMERAMDFILKSQARAEARIGQAEERQARTDEQLALTDEQLRQLSFRLESLSDLHRTLVQVATQTFEAQARINESSRADVKRTEEALASLAEQAMRTERRLEALIRIVEEGRGGGG